MGRNMKKIFRRASAIAIAAVMAFGTVSVSAANVTAADDQSEESIVSEKTSEEETTEKIIITGSDEPVSDSAENENIDSDSDEIQSVSETGADEETGDEDLETQEKTTESLTIGSGTMQDKNVPNTRHREAKPGKKTL